MTHLTGSTVKMLCVKSGIARKEITEEAQRLLDLYNNPNTDPETKIEVKQKLDAAIQAIEERVTTRKLKDVKKKTAGPQPPAL